MYSASGAAEVSMWALCADPGSVGSRWCGVHHLSGSYQLVAACLTW